jgi:hypothetical protein
MKSAGDHDRFSESSGQTTGMNPITLVTTSIGMKKFWLGGILVLASLHIGLGQVITGRSAAGALSITAHDTAGNAAGAKIRLATYEFEFTEPSGDNFLESRETGRLAS